MKNENSVEELEVDVFVGSPDKLAAGTVDAAVVSTAVLAFGIVFRALMTGRTDYAGLAVWEDDTGKMWLCVRCPNADEPETDEEEPKDERVLYPFALLTDETMSNGKVFTKVLSSLSMIADIGDLSSLDEITGRTDAEA